MEASFSFDFSALEEFLTSAATSLESGTEDPDIRVGLENAQALYLAEERQRYSVSSRGGGEWPDLAPSTKLQRYYQAGGRFPRQKGVRHADRLSQVSGLPFPILYITGDLYTSLYPGEPNNIFETTRDSVKAGTQDFKAIYHQSGGSRLPQRQILHMPTEELLAQMSEPILIGLRNMMAKAIGQESPALVAV